MSGRPSCAFIELAQLAPDHDRVGEVETVELNLPRAVLVDSVAGKQPHEVVVEGAVGHKLEGADRVSHALEVVALPMCKVIHGIHLPLVAGAQL